MKRVCFVLNVKPDRVEEYRRRHREVWPELRAALRQSGWSDYSLFLSPEGLLVGYLLTDDFAAAKAAMKSLPVNHAWQQEMQPLFEGLNAHADDGMEPLEEVFHLD